jgi:uncharacterized protein
MLERTITGELIKWKVSASRKPLILRGARQVGKSTIVDELGKTYKNYIKLNLERKEHARIFEEYQNLGSLVNNIFFLNNLVKDFENTLLFIDEIQEVPEAINLLRFFYEDIPELHVITAGSLLETILNEKVNIPVGRVQYLVLRPMSFLEFLQAMGEKQGLVQFENTPMADFAHDKLMSLFKTYMLIGGMPEVIKNYNGKRDLSLLVPLYDSLLSSYLNDVEKYAKNSSMVQVIRHVLKSMAIEAGNRIKFQNFGQSNYRSREVGEAMRALEKAFLIHLIYPASSVQLPIFPNKKKSPRLQIFDTGLLNHVAGIQKDILLSSSLESTYQGRTVEHIVGQELLASKFNAFSELHFWTRENKDSSSEVDFIYSLDGLIIPIEVKSGPTGRLKSLHLFMEESPHQFAVRLYDGKVTIDRIDLPSGKYYKLLNLPFYLAGRIEAYLKWFMSNP